MRGENDSHAAYKPTTRPPMKFPPDPPRLPLPPDEVPPTGREVVRPDDWLERHAWHDSHVRRRSDLLGPEKALFVELAEEGVALGRGIARLSRYVRRVPADRACQSAMAELRLRLLDLEWLCQVVPEVVAHASALGLDGKGILGEYLRGTYAWAHAVLCALEDHAARLSLGQLDGPALLGRLEDADNLRWDDLEDPLRAEALALRFGPGLAKSDAVRAFEAAEEELFAASRALARPFTLTSG